MQELASEQLWDTRVKQSAGQDNLGKPVSERPEMTDHFLQPSIETHEEVIYNTLPAVFKSDHGKSKLV